MVIVYQSYKVYIDLRVDQLQYMYKSQSIVYKVDKFILGTLLSSLILLNTRAVFCFIIEI